MDIFLEHLQTAIVGFFVSFLLLYFLTWRKRYKRLPPAAGGGLPIIGHLHLLAGSQLPHIVLGQMADKHGPVFTVRLGLHRVLIVSSQEVSKELFTTNDVTVSSRPLLTANKHLGYNGAMFGMSPYGSYWRELRKISSLELLSARRLELLKHVRVSETESSIKELYNLWREKKDSSGKVLVEMKRWFGDLTFNVMLRMVAGKRYFGKVASGEEETAKRFQKSASEFFYFLGLNLVGDSIPFLKWLDLGGYEKAMKRTAEEMDNIIGEWLEEHLQRRKSSMAINDQDFMDVMLSVTDGADLAGFDAHTVTKATCLNLIAGGNHTTSVMLIWGLSLLMNNPHALKKVQEELDIHVGRERQVNESDINNLIYFQAFVKETFRLYPAGALSGLREFSEDRTINGGYHIPKGTWLLINLWKLQRDPHTWSNPSEFRPERFLTTHKDVDFRGHHFELIPFGAGRRICPGTNLAVHMMYLVLATVLHSFELSTPSSAPIDMTQSAGLTNMKVTPLEVLISPRLPPNLY